MKTCLHSPAAPGRLARALTTLVVFAVLASARATQTDLTGPPGSGAFGSAVTVLPNGNFVVTDPAYDVPGTNNVGAVYLYDGVTLAIISALTGSKVNDQVGSGGVTVLSNGNYVVGSSGWNGARGAVTWGSGTTGMSGAVSAANSLVGNTAGDGVGLVTALSNGNYVVSSGSWDNGAVVNAGAVTWGNGTTGVSGEVSAANSLVGSTANDQVGNLGVTALNNGNYVVPNPDWDNGAVVNAGAVTWGSGTTGVTGAVSTANSLVGSRTADNIGNNADSIGVTALSNGNYVVSSSRWDNGAVVNAGAVTWGDGTTGVSGAVSAANSLVGSTADDQVGSSGVTALNNGNYVVRSPFWKNGGVIYVGAVTWGSGTTGVTGAVSTANSLVGSTAGDQVGNLGVTALNNGNYLTHSPYWDNGTIADAGAVTWGSGTTGVTGVISATNSLVGSTASDQVGIGGVTALNNGNYVVRSAAWDNGAVANAGAVTLGDGMAGTSSDINTANSVLGTVSGGGTSMVFAYDYLNSRLLVGYPSANRASLFSYAQVIAIALVPEGVRLRFTGVPGRNYTIERAPAVTGPWSTNATQTAPISGLIEHIDTNAPPDSAFYRTVASP